MVGGTKQTDVVEGAKMSSPKSKHSLLPSYRRQKKLVQLCKICENKASTQMQQMCGWSHDTKIFDLYGIYYYHEP